MCPGVAAQASSDAGGPEESAAQADEPPGPARGPGSGGWEQQWREYPRQRPLLVRTGPLGVNAQHGAWEDVEGGNGRGAVTDDLEEAGSGRRAEHVSSCP